jgi:hypothetical protein
MADLVQVVATRHRVSPLASPMTGSVGWPSIPETGVEGRDGAAYWIPAFADMTIMHVVEGDSSLRANGSRECAPDSAAKRRDVPISDINSEAETPIW